MKRDTRRKPDKGKRNLLKMKVFAFLKLRRDVGTPSARVRDIQRATGEGLRSLHVSVLKWTAWEYLERVSSMRLAHYSLSDRGLAYYNYMCTKSLSASRYEGLENEIKRTAPTAHYWVKEYRNGHEVGMLVYPFDSPECVKFYYYPTQIRIPKALNHILLWFKHEGVKSALDAVHDLGLDEDGLMADEVVRRGFISYVDTEKTKRLRNEGIAREREGFPKYSGGLMPRQPLYK